MTLGGESTEVLRTLQTTGVETTTLLPTPRGHHRRTEKGLSKGDEEVELQNRRQLPVTDLGINPNVLPRPETEWGKASY